MVQCSEGSCTGYARILSFRGLASTLRQTLGPSHVARKEGQVLEKDRQTCQSNARR